MNTYLHRPGVTGETIDQLIALAERLSLLEKGGWHVGYTFGDHKPVARKSASHRRYGYQEIDCFSCHAIRILQDLPRPGDSNVAMGEFTH